MSVEGIHGEKQNMITLLIRNMGDIGMDMKIVQALIFLKGEFVLRDTIINEENVLYRDISFGMCGTAKEFLESSYCLFRLGEFVCAILITERVPMICNK
jgi:hypothetical protein